jgi:hypothetical protein
MPSGKQILLSLLRTYSQQGVDPTNLSEATDRLRAGLLLHGSTAEETWAKVERVAWVRADRVQGLGLERTGTPILDILEALLGDEVMPTHVAQQFPALSQEDYEAAVFVLWALVSQVSFVQELNSVENRGELDEEASEDLIANYREKLAMYRKGPDDFVGRPPGWTATNGRVGPGSERKPDPEA